MKLCQKTIMTNLEIISRIKIQFLYYGIYIFFLNKTHNVLSVYVVSNIHFQLFLQTKKFFLHVNKGFIYFYFLTCL